ncbi:NAD(P)H-quinone oxidoreductase [Gilvimarinus sp. F26214L]|uniref:NAD(P)H-quinone oxidoreductase n=1 Tax=Gilvimarinus sp. DZF01 TaxID=3461371 RepID=UPI0040464774
MGDQMRYVELDSHGDPEVMKITEGPAPRPRPGEVLIKVAAAGVNRPDVAQRQGSYPPPPDASPILGLEVAGEVVELGEGVDASLLNTPVCALVNGGGYAEYATAPAGQCLPVPRGLSLGEAAALPETFFTVWTNVFDRARLQSGETILIHGGSSGIGSTAIQLAKAFGARVLTTAGSAEKCEFCRALGADLAINYREEDFVEAVQRATDSRGADVILDMVGGEYIQRNIAAAAVEGRMVSIAFLGGPKATVNFAPMMVKRLTMTGSTLRPRTAEVKAAIARNLREKVWPLIESGKIAPKIAAEFPFEDVVNAHKLMESSQHMGKIVLITDRDGIGGEN